MKWPQQYFAWIDGKASWPFYRLMLIPVVVFVLIVLINKLVSHG